jgi:non-canonical (house-cleaning) NTP pyrophosphatase
MANFSAWVEPVSLIAIVPVIECKIPTVTVSSVTARPVVFTSAVGGAALISVACENAKAATATVNTDFRLGIERLRELIMVEPQ